MNRQDLRLLAEREGIRPDTFSLDGTVKDDTYVLQISDGGWQVFFVERGQRFDEAFFVTEDEACRHLIGLLLRDKTTRVNFETREDVERRLRT